MELVAESIMKITAIIPIAGGSTLVSEGNLGKYGKGEHYLKMELQSVPHFKGSGSELAIKLQYTAWTMLQMEIKIMLPRKQT